MAKAPLTRPDLSEIDRKAIQLDALLNCMYGEGFSCFNSLNDELKDAMIWLAADLTADIRRAIGKGAAHA